MNYAPPLIPLLCIRRTSANTPSKTSFAKQNGGVAFCASTVWGKDGAPNLACCRFLKLKSLKHTGEGIACNRFVGKGHGRRRYEFGKSREATPHSCVVFTRVAANDFRCVLARQTHTGAENYSFPILKGNVEKSGCEANDLCAYPREITRKGPLRRS